jgi:hypothetical protein
MDNKVKSVIGVIGGIVLAPIVAILYGLWWILIKIDKDLAEWLKPVFVFLGVAGAGVALWPMFKRSEDTPQDRQTKRGKRGNMRTGTRSSLENLIEIRREKDFFKSGKPKTGFHRACQLAGIKPDTVDDWMKELHDGWSDKNYLPDLSNIPKNPN